MEKTPINRQKTDEYSVKDAGYGWERVYREEILSNEELVEMSAPEVKDAVIRRLGDFMDSDDSEYRRIDDYFQCLAFQIRPVGIHPRGLALGTTLNCRLIWGRFGRVSGLGCAPTGSIASVAP